MATTSDPNYFLCDECGILTNRAGGVEGLCVPCYRLAYPERFERDIKS